MSETLAEVFGFHVSDLSDKAERFRKQCLCPFNNRTANCTKDKVNDPLGVCSIFHDQDVVITCPVRFREDWVIASDAASFFFGADTKWTSLTECRLNDLSGKSAGNVDVVLVAYDDFGKVIDFGALEVQAVYISGNVRNPFRQYMNVPKSEDLHSQTSESRQNAPRPDYLSSSRKRLAPQLLFKGGILNSWGKKSAVAINRSFFKTLPQLKRVDKASADIAWLLYDLKLEETDEWPKFKLTKVDEVYTEFESSLVSITKPVPGVVDDFIRLLQEKLDRQRVSPAPKKMRSPFK